MVAPVEQDTMAEKSRVKILLVDDQPGKLLTYEAVLKELDEELVTANSAQDAFNALLRNDFAVVLIDVCMPDFDGYQLAAMIRDHPRFEKTPLIFISAVYLSEIDRLRGYESGAVDYVPVPVVPEILRAKVKIFVELHRKTRELERLNQELEDRVTERTAELERSGARLKESEERLRLASEAAEFGTYECNLREEKMYCSPQMRHLLGLGEADAELDFDSFLDLVHPGDRAAVRRYILAAPSEETRKRFDFRVSRPDGSTAWLLDCGRAAFHDGNEDTPSRVIGTILDVTERKRVEERQLLLMAELDHRVKNILANVSAIAKLSSKRVGSVDEFVKALDARIQSISKAHSLLRRDSWVGINLRDYIEELLVPFISRQNPNIVMDGEPINLRPRAAQSLALALHELATNAVKYGALSVPEGTVHITWRSTTSGGADAVRLIWRERNGPAVEEPPVTGFGMTAIKAVASELGATLEYHFHPGGVAYEFEGPLGRAIKANTVSSFRPGNAASTARPESEARKLRILIVEDEAVVALQVKSDLEAAGHKVVALATNLAQGVQLAGSSEIDVAFLDVRLGDDLSTAVAENLMSRGIPFAFGTGFEDDSILPAHLRGIPRLIKPYETDDISRLLTSLVIALPETLAHRTDDTVEPLRLHR
jgi:PAS domain S-box-containing protein